MPRMDLVESYLYNGRMLGPGMQVEVPDDDALISRLKSREEAANQRNRSLIEASTEVLPAGHPYRTLFPVNNSQPPQYEGDPTPVMQQAPSAQLSDGGSTVGDSGSSVSTAAATTGESSDAGAKNADNGPRKAR